MAIPGSTLTFPDLLKGWAEELLNEQVQRAIFFDCMRLEYAVRICLEHWVSECEPEMVYQCGKFKGIRMAGSNGRVIVHAPPIDRFYIASGTGYPPDWDFYRSAG